MFDLGAVLFYAATGRSPFGSGPTDIVLYRVLHEEPDLEDVPPGVRSLVAACLAKDPRKRPTPDVILQEPTGDPAPLLPTRAFAREHASAQVVSGPTPTIAAGATVLRADVSVPPHPLPPLGAATPGPHTSVASV